MILSRIRTLITKRLLADGDFGVFISILKMYFPVYKYQYAAILGLIALAAAATATSAWLVRDVVNDLFVKKEGYYIVPIFLFIVAAFFAKGSSTYLQSLLSARIANDIVARTQARLFSHILAQRVTFFERYSSDDLTMRVNQGSGAFGSILNSVILNGARDAATVASLSIVMVSQDPALTAICLLMVPAIFFCITMLLRRIKLLMKQEMLSIAQMNKHVREVVQGAKVIKSYNLEPIIKSEVEGIVEKIKDRSNKVAALQNAPVPIIDTLGGIGIGFTILYAGYRTIYGNYDPGTFMSFVTALLLALDPARRLSQLRASLKVAVVGVGMVNNLLAEDEPEEPRELPRTGKLGSQLAGGLGIALKDVSFGYSADRDVLKKFSLEVRPGEMIALVGPSGAGKSTVFSLLLRFHHHRAGKIFIGGQDIETLPVSMLRDHVSYVGQSNFIFSGTIRENLTLKRAGVTEEALIAACGAVGLHGHVTRLPQGYDTHVGELGALISGGQAQRLNIARAIIKDAPILLFDEVTSALDADNEELVRAYMHAQAGKKTILVIAHRLSTIRQADKIALVNDGQLQAFGTHHDLIRANEYYERVASLQLIA